MSDASLNHSHRLCIAPMMDCTDKHDRFFLRLISPHARLYTEMITAQALIHGDRHYLLGFHPDEHPLAVQLGGNDPKLLADAAEIGEQFGYDEINLNVGCPSDRVKSGQFGACLMLKPNLVADCVAAMQNRVQVPVTVKCRIGVDEYDNYEFLVNFIQTVAATGCKTFIIHARKAILSGLNPKQNRTIPPLCYDVVKKIKRDFPDLTIILNGGINSAAVAITHFMEFDGLMIGRSAYTNPYLLAELEVKLFNNNNILSRADVIHQLIPYIGQELAKGVKLTNITRHIFGLFQGQRGAAAWRRYLSEQAHISTDVHQLLIQALALVG